MTYLLSESTQGWQARIADTLTYASLARMSQRISSYLASLHSQPRVMLGYDMRFMGAEFARYLATALAQQGIQVLISPDLVSAPMVALSTYTRQAHLGIYISGGTEKADVSGFQFFSATGTPPSAQLLSTIENHVPRELLKVEDNFEQHIVEGRILYYDMLALYLNHIKEAVNLKAIQKAGIPMAFDVRHGVMGRILRKIFPYAHIIHAEPRADLGKIPSLPEPHTLDKLIDEVEKHSLSIGFSFDPTGTYMMAVNGEGEQMDYEEMIATLAVHLREHRNTDGPIYGTRLTPAPVQDALEAAGFEVEIKDNSFAELAQMMLDHSGMLVLDQYQQPAIAGHMPNRDALFSALLLLEHIIE